MKKILPAFRPGILLKTGLFLVAFLGFSTASFAASVYDVDQDTATVGDALDYEIEYTVDTADQTWADGDTLVITLPDNFPVWASNDFAVYFDEDNDSTNGGTTEILQANDDDAGEYGIVDRVLTIDWDETTWTTEDGDTIRVVITDGIPTYADATSTFNFTANTVAVDLLVDEDVDVDVSVGDLTTTNVEPASLRAGAESTNTISFTTTVDVENLGKIVVTYPAGWDVSDADGLTAGSLSGIDGTWTASVSGQVITLTQTGGTSTSAGAISFTLAGIATKGSTGSGGTYTITTTTANDEEIETDAAVTADTLISGSSGSTTLKPVTGVSVQSDANGVKLTWADPVSDDSTKIQILRGKNATVNGVAYAIVDKGVQSYVDTNVAEGDVLKYILRSSDGNGNYSTLSSEVTFTVGTDTSVSSTEDEDTTTDETTTEEDTTTDETTTDEDTTTEETTAPSFSDLSGHWSMSVVLDMAARGIVKGNPDGTFNPDGNLNRAESAALLYRILGLEEPTAPTAKPFSDVALDAWYAGYVSMLKDMQLTSGNPDGTYAPGKNTNRAEFIVLAVNVYKYLHGATTASATGTFVDVASGEWYAESVEIAAGMGVVSGYDCDGGKCFRPGADITRAEATKILSQLFFAQ